MTTPRFTIASRKIDEFGIVPGYGWVILENGKRIDWPMLETRAEAERDLADYRIACREVAREEASERRGLRMMTMQGVYNR